eukprot:gene31487-40894_t
MSNLNISVLVVIKVFVLALFFIQNWRVSSVLTKSYLVYLYDRYGEELKLHREVVENSCKRWGHIKHSSTEHSNVYGEVIYMQLRELQSKHVLVYGNSSSHAHNYVSLWTLLALQSNAKQYGQERSHSDCSTMVKKIGALLGCYQLTSILTSIEDDDRTEEELSAFSSMHSPLVNFVSVYVYVLLTSSERSPSTHALSFELGDLFEHFRRGAWFNATSPLDGLIFTSRITLEVGHAIISNLITPYLRMRDARSPAFALFFHKLQDDDKYMLSYKGRRGLGASNPVTLLRHNSRRLLSEERGGNDHVDMDTIGTSTQHENAMLGWLTVSKEVYSIDNHIFGSSALRILYDIRKEKKVHVSADNDYCHDEDKSRSIDFVYSSLLASPRAILVLKSLRFSFIQEWIIVHDHSSKVNESSLVFQDKHPKIREVFNPNSGNFGNPEKEYGLSLIPPERKGFVYFLDDDNYVHSNMWTLIMNFDLHLLIRQQLPLQKVVFTGEIKGCPKDDHTVLFTTKCVVTDGLLYQSVCRAHPDKMILSQLVASYHNGQYCPFV